MIAGRAFVTSVAASAADTSWLTASAADNAVAGKVSGKVVETMNTAGYTYVQVDTGTQKVWAASTQFAVKVGDKEPIVWTLYAYCQIARGEREAAVKILEQALKKIWGSDTYFNGRSMDVYIAKLRKYLKDDEKIEIVNIHGNGFRLVVQ